MLKVVGLVKTGHEDRGKYIIRMDGEQMKNLGGYTKKKSVGVHSRHKRAGRLYDR